MATERDIQSRLKCQYLMWHGYDLESPTNTFGPVDTKGMRSVNFVIGPEDDILEGDDISMVLYDSPDGVTYTEIPENKLLPTDKADRNVVQPANEASQTIGANSTERYVQLVITMNAIDAEHQSIIIDVTAVMEAELQAYQDWDPDYVSDGTP